MIFIFLIDFSSFLNIFRVGWHSAVGCVKHCRETVFPEVVAPVSHRWMGLLIWGTLLHQLGCRCCAEQKQMKRRRWYWYLLGFFFFFSTFASQMECCVMMSSWRRSLSIIHLAYWQMDVGRGVERACWVMITSPHFTYGGQRCESLWGEKCTRRYKFFAFFRFLMRTITGKSCFLISQTEFAIHSELWHLQSDSFTRQVRVSSLKQQIFILAWLRGDGRLPEEDLLCQRRKQKVAQCGWNSDSSINMRHFLQTEFKRSSKKQP